MKKLTPDEAQMLDVIINRREPGLSSIAAAIGTRFLTENEREEIRGVLADELLEKGLGKGAEPNEYGLKLDRMIGRLGEF